MDDEKIYDALSRGLMLLAERFLAQNGAYAEELKVVRVQKTEEHAG